MTDTSAYMTPPRRLSGTKVFFISMAAVVSGLFLFVILFFFLMIMVFSGIAAMAGATTTDSRNKVLEIDLRQPLLDAPISPSLFSDSPQSIIGIIQALETAKTDDKVKGVFIRGETGGMAPASAEELRLALLDFRESDKFVVTHAQGLNSTSIIPYQAISASDQIWLQESTSIATAGLYAESEFLGGTMELIGAQPQFIRHGAYKNAVNSYTEEGFTPEHREAMESLLGSIYDEAMDNIAQDRGLSRDVLTELFAAAPHPADEARLAGLIDKVGYLEEARESIRKRLRNPDIVFTSITDYTAKTHFGKPVIALVEAQGSILPGKSGGDNLFGSSISIGGETYAAALDKALKDDDVKAVVFRISSGGGSAAASDQIMAAVKRVQDADKPVVISMGQYAASGGYYIAAPADHIVAMPQTITGSIGVFGGKIAFEETFEKAGYNLEAIRIGGEYAGAYSIDTPFTEAQLDGYQREMDKIYEDFVGVVADGRNMSREAVIDVAEGRVWTGQQAMTRGLVDELGGFDTALRAAKRLAELDEDAVVHLKRFPRPKTRDELFNELLSGTASTGQDLEALSALMDRPEVQALLAISDDAKAQGAELKAALPTIR